MILKRVFSVSAVTFALLGSVVQAGSGMSPEAMIGGGGVSSDLSVVNDEKASLEQELAALMADRAETQLVLDSLLDREIRLGMRFMTTEGDYVSAIYLNELAAIDQEIAEITAALSPVGSEIVSGATASSEIRVFADSSRVLSGGFYVGDW